MGKHSMAAVERQLTRCAGTLITSSGTTRLPSHSLVGFTQIYPGLGTVTKFLQDKTISIAVPKQTPSISSGDGSSSNTGAIVGGVIGGIAALALLGALLWFLRRRNRKGTQAAELAGDHAHGALAPKSKTRVLQTPRRNPRRRWPQWAMRGWSCRKRRVEGGAADGF